MDWFEVVGALVVWICSVLAVIGLIVAVLETCRFIREGRALQKRQVEAAESSKNALEIAALRSEQIATALDSLVDMIENEGENEDEEEGK